VSKKVSVSGQSVTKQDARQARVYPNCTQALSSRFTLTGWGVRNSCAKKLTRSSSSNQRNFCMQARIALTAARAALDLAVSLYRVAKFSERTIVRVRDYKALGTDTPPKAAAKRRVRRAGGRQR